MLKKAGMILIVCCLGSMLYAQRFETTFHVGSGLYVDGNSMLVEVAVRMYMDESADPLTSRNVVAGNRTYAVRSDDLFIPGSLKGYDVIKFTVTDANGKIVSERPSRHNDPNFFESPVRGSGHLGNSFVDLHDWFELDKEGLYFVSARWQFSADNGKTYTGQTDKKIFRIISSQGRKIYGLTQETMCMPQSKPEGGRLCELELVTIGEPAMPYILLWLEDFHNNMPWTNEVRTSPKERWFLLEVVSQIGSERGLQIIADANNLDDALRQHYYERIDIWQSPDRYDKLIAKLSIQDFTTVKWAIYKLGILGDIRAIPVLEQVAQQHERLDIRETAKDAVAHLKDSSVPMYYRLHNPSEKIVLSSSKTTYRLGEPIEIICKLMAGPYGSRTLSQFSKPAYHFLPWGVGSEPYRIQMRFNIHQDSFGRRISGIPEMMPGMGMPGGGMTSSEMVNNNKKGTIPAGVQKEYVLPIGDVLPTKELQSARYYFAERHQEFPEGYINNDVLGTCEPLNLGPNENREYTISDLNKSFELNRPGLYVIKTGIPLFKASSSNQITINICDANSK